MKILEERYPKGTFKGQKSDGRYINQKLYQNLEHFALKIVEDMTFLGICSSSTLEVGTGKSVLISQIGEAWTYLVNKHHRTNIEFTTNNIVFKPKDLIDRAFKVPKYSCIILDEWEDAHFWSELGVTLRQFFRKCRQLNLFILVIIPNFFQMPMNYAISRSAFFIDVKFGERLQRGFFDFYSFKQKKRLYLMGKKTQNYNAAVPKFQGRFGDGYGVNEKEYREAKYKDMVESEDSDTRTIAQVEKDTTRKLFHKIYKGIEKVTVKDLSEALGISTRTGHRYLQSVESDIVTETNINNTPTTINDNENSFGSNNEGFNEKVEVTNGFNDGEQNNS